MNGLAGSTSQPKHANVWHKNNDNSVVRNTEHNPDRRVCRVSCLAVNPLPELRGAFKSGRYFNIKDERCYHAK